MIVCCPHNRAEQWFLDHVREADNGCLEWTGAVNNKGYGTMRDDGQKVYAHRYAVKRSDGAYPAVGLNTDHLCRNARCVRRDHLEVVSPQENTRRGVKVYENRKLCISGLHDITEPSSRLWNGAGWTCWECRKATGRRKSQERKGTKKPCETCGKLVHPASLARHRKLHQ